jgi:hypothetical protein
MGLEARTSLGQDSKITLALAFTFVGLGFGLMKWLDSRFEASKTDIAAQLKPLTDAQTSILMRLDRMETSANNSHDEIKELRSQMQLDVSEIEFENWGLRMEKALQVVHPGIEIPPLKHQ